MKFGRKYRLTIQSNDRTQIIAIETPFTLQFNIVRSALSDINTACLAIYNLSEATRSAIFRDFFLTPISGAMPPPYCILEAGYDELTPVFQGDIYEASSARQGSEIITTITARDGGYDSNQTKSFVTLKKDTSVKDLVEFLIDQFPNLKKGTISDYKGTLRRPVVINGNTYEFLKKYTNGGCFIDDSTINATETADVINSDIFVFDDETGLLETPRRENSLVTVTTLFEPRVRMGQRVRLESSVQKIYNGDYKVIGVSHQGIISDAVNGRCQSTFNLFSPIEWQAEYQKNGSTKQ